MARGIPNDVIVAARESMGGGQKITAGFTCSHDFDTEHDPGGESGPLYYAQLTQPKTWAVEVWANDVAGVQSTLGQFGVQLSADTVAAMETTRANANCG